MSRVSAALRQKRFEVDPSFNVKLMVETDTGDRITLSVKNSSLTGMAAAVEGSSLHPSFAVGKIIPESKLIWDGNEISLGRLAIRRVETVAGMSAIAFSCIDTKLPLFGSLSAAFPEVKKGENAFDYELGAKKFNLSSFVDNDYAHKDLLQKCRDYSILFKDLEATPLWQFYAVRHKIDGLKVSMALPKKKRPTPFINFGSYDYLGLSSHPEVKAAGMKAIEEFGISATATPPLSGRTKYHEELESKIAKLLRKEDTVLFNSGFAANVGGITAMLGLSDIAIADILSHASIHDGLSASSAKVRLFRHNDHKHLEKLLKENRDQHAGALTIHEGLFSMDGDVPNLKEFVNVSKKYNARTYLDEVHSFGVVGTDGLGAAERCGVLDDIDLFIGSLNKGFGAGGGFIATSKEIATWLRGFARTEIFSSCVAPVHAAAAIKSLELVFEREGALKKLHENIRLFHEGLKEIGFKVISDPHSPIVPIIIGEQEVLGKMNEIMLEHGVFVNTIVYPAVAVEASRFRFSLSAAHGHSDLQLALVALKQAAKAVGYNFGD